MIQRYNKTNKNIDLNNNQNIKFLAFCNWSFYKENI